MESWQDFANWCRDERDSAAKSNENMRSGMSGFFSITNGERRDGTADMIAHNERIIRNMDDLLRKMERDQGVKPA